MFRDVMSVTCFIDNETNKKICLKEIIDVVENGGGGLTPEQVQDIIGLMVEDNIETGITVTYDNINKKLDFVVDKEYLQEVFIGTPVSLPTHPAIIFEEITVGGEQVYQMRVNVP